MNGTQITYKRFNDMTVPQLKEIAERMAAPYPSRIRKADLISIIMVALEDAHAEALEDDEYVVKDDEFLYAGVLWTGATAKVLKAHDRMVRRFNPEVTRDKNGMVKLTPKQRRRIHKNDRRNAKRFGLEKVNA